MTNRRLPVVTPARPTGDEVPDERMFPDLTPQQERFVCEYLADPTNGKAAAIRAGYSEGSAHVSASRLLRHQGVLRAISEGTVKALGAALPLAVRKVSQLSINARSEYVQLEAAKDIMDRAGLSAPKRVNLGGALSVTFDLG